MKATTRTRKLTILMAATARGLAVAALGSAFLATGLASAESREREAAMQFADYLARAIQIWTHELKAEAAAQPAGATQQAGHYFIRPEGTERRSMKSHDDGSSDDRFQDDGSSDDRSADDGSSDDDSQDKSLNCLPALEVNFLPDLLRVSISSSKKLKGITLLFDDGSTQAVRKPKGKQGVFGGTGEKSGLTLTGVWVLSGCNDKVADPETPCPAMRDDDSSSDDSDKPRKWFKDALVSGHCEDGDWRCPRRWSKDDDSSSDDKSDDGSSDDGSSDDGSDDEKPEKCGQFFENEMAQVEVPVISIADASALEGSDFGNPLEFIVTLSEPVPTGQTVEVTFMTVDGTAIAGEPGPLDYVADAGMLLFSEGDLMQIIRIMTIGDDYSEGDETFEVVLISASNNARLGKERATGVVLNDDDEDD